MNTRIRVAAAGAALATAVAGAVLVPTQVDAAGRVPTIRATMLDTSLRLSTHRVAAGLVRFDVVAPSGDHTLQVFRLRRGYPLHKFERDLDSAFMGMVMAVRRIDRKVVWAGGTEVKANRPGRFAQVLTAGTYYVMDQNRPAMTKLTVTGAVAPRGAAAPATAIVATPRDRFRAPSVLPRRGWTLVKNTSDEPHYLVMQHVRTGTTHAQVRRFFASGANGKPSWMGPGETSTGVLSAGTRTRFHYNLPRGQYLLTCWWPSAKTGTPHAMMGMRRMITLR